jgi:hypothetical protein
MLFLILSILIQETHNVAIDYNNGRKECIDVLQIIALKRDI